MATKTEVMSDLIGTQVTVVLNLEEADSVRSLFSCVVTGKASLCETSGFVVVGGSRFQPGLEVIVSRTERVTMAWLDIKR